MSKDFDHGPRKPYRITWKSGKSETVLAHAVNMPHAAFSMNGPGRELVTIYAEIKGRWTLLLAAHQSEIQSIRSLEHTQVSRLKRFRLWLNDAELDARERTAS